MNYTSIEQSKKLLELGLNPETADMCYVIDYAESNKYGKDDFNLQVDIYGFLVQRDDNIPCWSVGALQELIPKSIRYQGNTCYPFVDLYNNSVDYMVGGAIYKTIESDSAFGAIYNMVVWLLDNNYIEKGK